MTEKQENILKAAIHLFSEKGYTATSTSAIAKCAGVSEGLIFKHFMNKEGLLNAILLEGEKRIKKLFSDIVMETNPKEVIRKTIELPFTGVPDEEYDFWRLQFKLKWEIKNYSNEKMEPLAMALTNAFRKLEYPDPELEAEFLIYYIDAIAEALLKGYLKDKMKMNSFLLGKYKV